MPKLEISKVHDAYERPGECPLCVLLAAAEETYLRSFTHSRVMEPNVRVQTNESGFCPTHYRRLYEGENKLGLALIVHTHLVEKLPMLTAAIDDASRPEKRGRDRQDRALAALSSFRESCFLCGLLSEDLDRYCFTILYLWGRDPGFGPVFRASKGFCIRHFVDLSAAARKLLRADRREAWMAETAPLMKESLQRLEQEVLAFTQLHRASHAGPGVGEERTALARALQKLAGGVFRLE
jgi:hypothetical protein